MSRKTTPRETEKPKKLTRAQKKEIDAVLRKYKGDGKPRTAQATIPYEAIYPDGVCRIDRRTFSKCIAFEDISYQLAQPETRTAIFEHLCDLYNYVDASIHVQFSFTNLACLLSWLRNIELLLRWVIRETLSIGVVRLRNGSILVLLVMCMRCIAGLTVLSGLKA